MTKSLEDYLEEIHVLIRETGRARVRDVARALNVKMPSVVKGIAELKKLGLVIQEPYSDIELTPKGRRCAAMVLGRHNVLRDFLVSLGVSAAIADKDACLMEHILSAETMDRIRDFLESEQRPAKQSPAKTASKKTPKQEQ